MYVCKFLHRDKEITEKQLQSNVLHQSPNVLYDIRKSSEMGEHVTNLLRLIKVITPLDFIPQKKSLRN